MRALHLVPLCLLIACGDNGEKSQPPDAHRPDTAPDVLVPVCAHTETNDTTNDDLFGTGTAEATNIAFTTSTETICGKFNMGHYNTMRMNMDVDSYSITVPAQAQALLYLTAPGAENFNAALIEIYGMANAIDETGEFVGTFATTSVTLTPGQYVVTVSAFDDADITAPLDYQLKLVTDPASRCNKSAATPAFVEANEGSPTTGAGNDVYEVVYGANSSRTFTTNPNDAPEPTNITVQADMEYRITGVNSTFTATPLSWMDSFQDRDTYKISTGPVTNQLSIRLNWPGTTADFDLLVYAEGSLFETATGWYNIKAEDEFTTFAVAPNSTYWVFVGADDSSTGQPIDYDLNVCGYAVQP